MIQFAHPSSTEFLPMLHQLLHIGKGHQWKESSCFPAEPYRITELSSLAKTNSAAQYNYEHFIRTMAKMIQKYGNIVN